MIAAEIVESMGDAAFAARPQGGIVAWNKAAERLLGYRDCDVLGRPCCQVLAGRDMFGNQFCGENCALVQMALHRKAIEHFEVLYRHRSGKVVPIGVSILVVPNGAPSKLDLIHLLSSRGVELAKDGRVTGQNPRFDTAGVPGNEYLASQSSSQVCLTRREIEVLRLMGGGFGTRAIAAQLTISVATVRNHIQSILEGLEVHSRLEAVSVARRRGLL
jgi:PAS domain S-box-containing protein